MSAARATARSTGTACVGVVEHASAAVLVTGSGDGVLLDRRRVELIAAGLSAFPHHHEGAWAMGRYLNTPGARRLSLAEAVALVERVRASAMRGAAAGLDELAAAIPVPIAAIALRACPALPPTTEGRIADNRAQTMADSVMYREVLAAVAEARGWRVHWYDRARVTDEAAGALGPARLNHALAGMGRAAGPPWRAEHKLAATAALAALARLKA